MKAEIVDEWLNSVTPEFKMIASIHEPLNKHWVDYSKAVYKTLSEQVSTPDGILWVPMYVVYELELIISDMTKEVEKYLKQT